MKKERLLGHLERMKQNADDGHYDYVTSTEIFDDVIELVEQLEEPIPKYIPYYPSWSYYPTPTWYSTNNETFTYNGIDIKKDTTLADPNDWSIKTTTAPNFTVVK